MCSTPLGSPTVPSKRSYVHAAGHRTAGSGHRVGVQAGWVPGWGMGLGGYQEGYTGYYPASWKAEPTDSGAGPGRPQGLEWVVCRCSARPSSMTTHSSTPGASGARFAVMDLSPLNAASGPIRARFSHILLKVSKNPIVSSKNVQKACHSPHFQNGLQKSPLVFSRFPFSPAFSHKELMVVF